MASFRFNTDSSQFNYISDVNDTLPKRRPCNPKVYQSFQLSDQLKPAPYHRLIQPALFKKYDTTSQIKYLPGCIKRDNNEINDNINMSKKPTEKRRESYQSKVQHDYRSNVACLPGSAINEMKIEPKSKRTSVKNTRISSLRWLISIRNFMKILIRISHIFIIPKVMKLKRLHLRALTKWYSHRKKRLLVM